MSHADTPTVSVVIGAYNAVRWIEATVESVLAQTYRDFELIVVDDGSTDATPEILARYGPPVRLVRKPNGGAPSARNRGISEARGRYVAFLDHDDLWEPEKLERQMALFGERPEVAWCYTDAYFFQDDPEKPLLRSSQSAPVREGDVLRPLVMGNFVVFASSVVRRDVFDRVGLFNESELFRHVDDWDMWLRVAPHYASGYVDEPLVRYRMHATQATQTMDLHQALRNRLAVLDAARQRNPAELGLLYDEAVANVEFAVARNLLNREQRAEARSLLLRALRRQPQRRALYTYLLATLVPRPALRLLGRLRRSV